MCLQKMVLNAFKLKKAVQLVTSRIAWSDFYRCYMPPIYVPVTVSQECASRYLLCTSNGFYHRIKTMIIFVICLCKQDLCFPFNMPDITNPCLTTLSYKQTVLLHFAAYFINTDVTELNRFPLCGSQQLPLLPAWHDLWNAFTSRSFYSAGKEALFALISQESFLKTMSIFLLEKQNSKQRNLK